MKNFFFTALIPASNIDSEIKRLIKNYKLSLNFPNISILEFYNCYINKEDFNKDINNIPEFKTEGIIYSNSWWSVKLPETPLNTIFNKPNSHLFPKNDFVLLIAKDPLKEKKLPDNFNTSVIRNWELGFFELIIWDDNSYFDNYEIIHHWSIKKLKPKADQ